MDAWNGVNPPEHLVSTKSLISELPFLMVLKEVVKANSGAVLMHCKLIGLKAPFIAFLGQEQFLNTSFDMWIIHEEALVAMCLHKSRKAGPAYERSQRTLRDMQC